MSDDLNLWDDEMVYANQHDVGRVRVRRNVFGPYAEVRIAVVRDSDRRRGGDRDIDKVRREHLKEIDGRMDLRGPRNLAAVDEVFSDLHTEAPWLAPVTEPLWLDARKAVASGLPFLKFAPTLIVGPPGCGKSTVARTLAALADVPSAVLDASTVSERFAITGLDSGFSTSRAGLPLQTILKHKAANPILVVDELEKCSKNTAKGHVAQAFLPFLESGSARRFRCPFIELEVDMSHVNWLFTANGLEGIHEPLLDRLRVVHVEGPGDDHLEAFIETKLEGVAVHRSVVDRLIGEARRGRWSLRKISRTVEAMKSVLSRPVCH